MSTEPVMQILLKIGKVSVCLKQNSYSITLKCINKKGSFTITRDSKYSLEEAVKYLVISLINQRNTIIYLFEEYSDEQNALKTLTVGMVA